MDASTDPAVEWLLRSEDPSVRYFTLTDILEQSARSAPVRQAKSHIPTGPRMSALLAGQQPDGGFGVRPYQKFRGAHWRLVSLVELGIPPDDARAHAAAEQVLDWLHGDAHRGRIQTINGLVRRCASQEGNALGVCTYLGLGRDPRVKCLADSLIEWQWPDGGWNCDKKPEAHHSSFYESLRPLWGLLQYHRATGDAAALAAAERTTDFFLRHRLFRSERTGEVINPAWLKLHYPLYWHYDILQCLVILTLAGRALDPRAQEALGIVEGKRLPAGVWKVEGCEWAAPGTRPSQVEVVDWGRRGPNEMITLNALRVLKAAGRKEFSAD